MLASTSEVYGDPLEHPQRESYWGNVNPIGPRSVYDEAKRFAEALTMAYHRDARRRRADRAHLQHVRAAARAGDGRVVSNFLVQAMRGEPLTVYGDGTQTRSFCYVDDLVAGSSGSSTSDCDGTDEPRESERVHRPRARRSSCSRSSAAARRSCSRRCQIDDPVRRCPDISLATRELGWEPKIVVRDGLERLHQAYREHGVGA